MFFEFNFKRKDFFMKTKEENGVFQGNQAYGIFWTYDDQREIHVIALRRRDQEVYELTGGGLDYNREEFFNQALYRHVANDLGGSLARRLEAKILEHVWHHQVPIGSGKGCMSIVYVFSCCIPVTYDFHEVQDFMSTNPNLAEASLMNAKALVKNPAMILEHRRMLLAFLYRQEQRDRKKYQFCGPKECLLDNPYTCVLNGEKILV